MRITKEMADSAWEEVPLDDGWEEVPLAGPTIDKGEAAMRAISQGPTLGLMDEWSGIVQGGMDLLSGDDSVSSVNKQLAEQGFKGDVGPTSSGEVYKEGRDEFRVRDEAAKAQHPGLYNTLNIASSFLTPGLGVGKAIKPMTGLQAAKQGAMLGAAQGFGNTDEIASMEALQDIAAGGVLGGISGGALQALGNKAANLKGDDLKRAAEIASAKAQGLERGTRNKLNMNDYLDESRIRAVGRQGLDDKLVTIGAGAKDMALRNRALKKDLMDTRQFAYDTIDNANASTFNPMDVAQELPKDLGKFNWASQANAAKLRQMEEGIQSIGSRGGRPIPMKEAQELVEELGSAANFDATRPTQSNKMAKDVYAYVRNKMNESAMKAGDDIGQPGIRDTIEATNQKYSIAKDADKLLKNKIARDANKKFSLTDTIALSSQNPLIYFPKKVYEEYGDKATAIGFDKIGDLVNANPQAFGRFGGALQQAAQRGPQALGAAHFVLQQKSPEYREHLMKLREDE